MGDLNWLSTAAQGSPWVFLGLGIISILTGRLVPARTMEARMKDKSEQIEQWRSAHKASEEARRESNAQVEKLLDQGRTTNLLLANLGKPGPGGGS